jgi:hypothetical protein
MMFSPSHVLITGIEDDPSGMLRVYFSPNGGRRLYMLIENEEDKQRARDEWAGSFGGHLFVDRPPEDGVFEEGKGE